MILTQIIKITDENESNKLEKKIPLHCKMEGLCLHILAEKSVDVEVLTSIDGGKTLTPIKSIKESKLIKKLEPMLIDLSSEILFSELIIKVNKNSKKTIIKLCHGVK